MTKIYIVRHGEAEGNVFRRIHGQFDGLLTPMGMRQVEFVKRRFETVPIDACYSSDLTRACLTARGVFEPKGLKLRRRTAFREINLGVWEDLPFGYIYRYDGERMGRFNHDPVHWSVEGGEVFDQFTQRFIDGMKAAAEENDGGSIALFCHSAVLRSVLYRLFFWGELEKVPYCDNTAVSCLTYDKGSFTYDYLSDNSHVPPELSTFHRQAKWRTGGMKKINLYYEPWTGAEKLPEELAVPEAGKTMLAMLDGEIVGSVTVDAPNGEVGHILDMGICRVWQGFDMSDQLLGCAVSHFRHLGCTRVSGSGLPENLTDRYGFRDGVFAISPKQYRWDWE